MLKNLLRRWDVPVSGFSSRETTLESKKSHDGLSIMVIVRGGLGDMIITLNWIYRMRAFAGFSISKIVVLHECKIDMSDILKSFDILDASSYTKRAEQYDVVIDVLRFPMVTRCDMPKIEAEDPRLAELLRFYIEHHREFPDLYRNSPESTIWSIANGQNRLQQPDASGILGVGKDFSIKLPPVANERDILSKFGLSGRRFITMNRGTGITLTDATKCWPLESCGALAAMLRREYPAFAIVQIGPTGRTAIDGVDMCLTGATTMREIFALLNVSALHIDGEGGFVHLRSAMGSGLSVVLFGPTSVDFFGYPGNINVSSDACPHWCEWVTRDWYKRCMCGTHACMKAITPEAVMDRILKEWKP
jgi:hypothetical protein